MRLKSIDGPLAIHNGNSDDILNSPKRINTLQNSNLLTTTSNFSSDLRNTTTTNNQTPDNFLIVNGIHTELLSNNGELLSNNVETLNNINTSAQDKVQWCNVAVNQLSDQLRTINNRLNINNSTLATSLRNRRPSNATSPTYSVSSPDDSLLDYEDAHHPSGSSAEGSPQDEDRAFDVSDSESSDESNNLLMGIKNDETTHQRGIINPNYPGFQHLAHTLDFKLPSETDFTDDDFESESLNTNKSDINNINNNNNEEEAQTVDHIDSVNRLDSIENIQKVFYDKPVFDINSSGNSNHSDEDAEMCVANKIEFNIKSPEEEVVTIATPHNIIGDFRTEVALELGRISLENAVLNRLEKAVVQELEETIDKLHESITAILPPEEKIALNIQEPLTLNTPSTIQQKPVEHFVLDDAKTVKMVQDIDNTKICDAFLSNGKEKIPRVRDDLFRKSDGNRANSQVKMSKEEMTRDYKEKEDDCGEPNEKMECFAKKQQFGSLIAFPRREFSTRNRRSTPLARDNKNRSTGAEVLGSFDVYNIETAMPKIDLEVIESHLRAAREEERRRRTDREEIRRRLAMGCEDDYYSDRPGRKPSLQARLQSGMNLQICFMNETVSDNESPNSDSETPTPNPKQPKTTSPKNQDILNKSPQNKSPQNKSLPITPARPATLSLSQPPNNPLLEASDSDFFTKQARLQTEARMALAQAKEMARMQMEIERQRQKKSPITEMVRHSLEKVGIPFPEEKRRLSRMILTEMNVAQLQVIVNDLHTQIETLNENLVKFLMTRDDLHMEQDSMLVDIEDLTRYLGAKEQVVKEQHISFQNNENPPPSPAPSSPLAALNSSMKPHLHRIAMSLGKK